MILSLIQFPFKYRNFAISGFFGGINYSHQPTIPPVSFENVSEIISDSQYLLKREESNDGKFSFVGIEK